MCDYSLMGVPNRLAREAEELVVHRFPTGTLGLASSADLNPSSDPKPVQARAFWTTLREFFSPPEALSPPAVCIPPGAILMLHDIPTKMQSKLGSGPDERVTFTQITAAANHYRDAVRFEGGREIPLQDLSVGQRAEVIDLTLAQDRETDGTELVGLPVTLSPEPSRTRSRTRYR
jgi:hypothetical protein